MNEQRRFFPLGRIAIATAVAAFAAAGIAGAQTDLQAAPAPAAAIPTAAASPPSYATPSGDEQIAGTIAAVTGKYTLQLRDDRGFTDNVALHPGTIINPTGLKLLAGMPVTIVGHNAGATFTANVINAPYALAVAVPGLPAYGFGAGWGWGFGPAYRGGFWW